MARTSGSGIGVGVGLLFIVGLIIFGSIFFGSWYTVDETERGVFLRNGAIASEAVVEPGLHFKLPFIESVDKIDISYRSVSFRDPPLESYSFDQQLADFKLSINYHISASDVIQLRREYVTLENLESRVIATFIPKVLKAVFGTYTAQASIQQRNKLNNDFLVALQESVVDEPITIDSVQLEDISFSDAYEKSIEDKQLAEVAVQLLVNQQKQAEVEAKTRVIKAEAEAAAVIASAKAEAERTRLNGEAEASAIKARGAALGDNPELIRLIAAEKWNGSLPTTMPPGSAVPFVNIPIN